MRMPDAEHSLNIKKEITFIIENKDNVPTSCQFVRKKLCDCKLQEVKISMSKTEKVYNCPHRHLANVTINHTEILVSPNVCHLISSIHLDLQPKSVEYVTVVLSYHMEGLQSVCYCMQFSQNRCIELYFLVMGLRVEYATLSTYGWELKFAMKDVFLATKRPGRQAYWIYNNSRRQITYLFDTTEIDNINEKYGRTVLQLMNPQGMVDAKCIYPIYFILSPVDTKKFDVSFQFDYQPGWW